jgi:hypothetical protein
VLDLKFYFLFFLNKLSGQKFSKKVNNDIFVNGGSSKYLSSYIQN